MLNIDNKKLVNHLVVLTTCWSMWPHVRISQISFMGSDYLVLWYLWSSDFNNLKCLTYIRVNNHDLGTWFCGNLKIFSRGCSFSFLWQVSQSVTLQSCSNFKSWKPIRKFSSLLTPWAKLWYKGGKRLKTDQISKQQTFEILKFEVS